jgi:hypothetical protein
MSVPARKTIVNQELINPPAQLIKTPTTFAGFYEAGYTRLVPVIPPDAEISEGSSLLKRKDARGKAVGVRGRNGKWFGFDWLPHESAVEDLDRWQEMQAGTGIKTGGALIFIDADTMNEDNARTIRDAVELHFGRLPTRVGRYPKVGYPIRISEPVRYSRIEFGALDPRGALDSRVEILSEGRQFVAHGIHPVTKEPYYWPRDLVPFDELPITTPEKLTAFMEALRAVLPAAKPIISEGATTRVNQAALKGDIGLVRKAVEAIPNKSATFPTRESYRDFGYAIKAALPDDPDEAFDIFADWCERWEEGANDPAIVEADWRRMKPPFRRGAGWLYELAEEHAPGKFDRSAQWFEPLDDAENLFGQPEAAPKVKFDLRPTPYAFPNPADIPPRQWLYGDHYIRGFLSATVAPGGLGKSSLTIVEALAMASGKPLLGVIPHGKSRVWMWNGEDPLEELNRRVAGAMQFYGLTPGDIGDRLLVDSGMQQEIVLAKMAREGAVLAEPVFKAIVSAIEGRQIDVLVADPFVSSHRVSENDNGAIDLVAKGWGRIAFATRTSIELVHHVRKVRGAEVTPEDARGASALANAARSVRALTPMTAAEGQKIGLTEHWHYFRFGGVTKSNMAPAAAAPVDKAEWLTLQSEQLGNGQSHGTVSLMFGDAVGVVARATMTGAARALDQSEVEAAFQLLGSADWRADTRAGDWVGHPVAQAFRLDASSGPDRATINGILKQWAQEGLIQYSFKLDGQRKRRQFVRVADAARSGATSLKTDGVFG